MNNEKAVDFLQGEGISGGMQQREKWVSDDFVGKHIDRIDILQFPLVQTTESCSCQGNICW